MTHLRRLGLADALRDAAPLPVDYAQDVIFCTALTGPSAHELRTFRQAFQLVPGRYGPQPECGQQVPQPVLEEVLRAAVSEAPLVTLLTGWHVQEVRVQPGTPAIPIRLAAGTRLEPAVRDPPWWCRTAPDGPAPSAAGFVIGADGGSSAVRRSLGIRLEGGSAALSNISIMFRSADLGPASACPPPSSTGWWGRGLPAWWAGWT